MHYYIITIGNTNWEGLTHAHVTSYVIFHTKYTRARRFELVTSSLARNFLTISPT
jgi:hypothetical protein